MKKEDWQKLSSETVAKNPWWTYKKDAYRRASGQTQVYHYQSKNPGATIVAIRDDGRIAMVTQYRPSMGLVEIGLPAGGIDDGEYAKEGAKRELLEETGATAKNWEHIGKAYVSPGMSDDYMEMFIASDVTLGDFTPMEEEEGMVLSWMTAEEVDQGIENGEIWSVWSIVPWLRARKRIQEIIDGK
jgi:ADP-ribose pyrophosphatase